jgi:hypothetical protein
MESSEFIIDFTDITLSESDGVFKQVSEVMRQEFPGGDKWTLRSFVTISGQIGMGKMTIQCHGDGSIYILEYEPSIGDLFYNPDIQTLSMWAQTNGWKIPQPHPDLIKSNKEFWKHFYDTLVIDSDYLDDLYGIRPQLQENGDNNE